MIQLATKPLTPRLGAAFTETTRVDELAPALKRLHALAHARGLYVEIYPTEPLQQWPLRIDLQGDLPASPGEATRQILGGFTALNLGHAAFGLMVLRVLLERTHG